MNAAQHMCSMLPTASTGKDSICRSEDRSLTLAVSSTAGKNGVRRAEKTGSVKVRQVKIRTEGGWGFSCHVDCSWEAAERGGLVGGRGGGGEQLNMIHFRAIKLHSPRESLWLCNLGNSVFAALSTEPQNTKVLWKRVGTSSNSPQYHTFPDSELSPTFSETSLKLIGVLLEF